MVIDFPKIHRALFAPSEKLKTAKQENGTQNTLTNLLIPQQIQPLPSQQSLKLQLTNYGTQIRQAILK